MWNIQKIGEELCNQLLSTYADNPLIKEIAPDDARLLLTGALYGSTGDELLTFEECVPAMMEFLGDYLKTTEPEKISIPVLLLNGSLLYIFSKKAPLSSSALTSTINAPLISYYVPYAHDADVAYPAFALTPGSAGILFHPDVFRQVTLTNPTMFDVILPDRERVIATIFHWLPVLTADSPGNRIAWFLFAHLPQDYQATEVIHIKQEEIAQRIALSRATVNSGISFLFNKKIITTGRGAITVDTGRLREYIGTSTF